METWTQQRARLESAAETLQSEPIGQAIRAALSRLDELEEAAVMFLGCLPADMGIWRALGLDTSRLTMVRMKTMLALSDKVTEGAAPESKGDKG